MKIAQNSINPENGEASYDLFSDDYYKVCNVILNKTQVTKLAARKGNEIVSWTEVWHNSDEQRKRGVYAVETKNVKDVM